LRQLVRIEYGGLKVPNIAALRQATFTTVAGA
jgi:hypothetical protein